MNELALDRARLERLERNAADHNAQQLDNLQQARWTRTSSSHRFQAFLNKKLVAYRLLFLVPEITDIFTCQGLEVSLSSGLTSFWESQETKKVLSITEVPTEVAPSCFMWMLQRSSLELTEHKGVKSLRFPVLYRTQYNPDVRVDGAFYLLEKAVFEHTEFKKVDY